MEIFNQLQFWLVPCLYGFLYSTALILALVFYRRCPGACGLVITASLMSLGVVAGRVAYHVLVFQRDGDVAMYGIVLMAFAIINWVGYGLMIVAVFVGRNSPTATHYRPARSWDDDDEWDQPAPAKTTENTGVQQHR